MMMKIKVIAFFRDTLKNEETHSHLDGSRNMLSCIQTGKFISCSLIKQISTLFFRIKIGTSSTVKKQQTGVNFYGSNWRSCCWRSIQKWVEHSDKVKRQYAAYYSLQPGSLSLKLFNMTNILLFFYFFQDQIAQKEWIQSIRSAHKKSQELLGSITNKKIGKIYGNTETPSSEPPNSKNTNGN